jgi:predicted helicase
MSLALKPTHATVKAYYETLHQYGQLHIDHEGAVRSAFHDLLAKSGRKAKPPLTLVPEYRIERARGSSVIVDGALVDLYHLPHGYWEAKDEKDDLAKEVQLKLDKGYPRDNIIFQAPERAILYQGGARIFDENISSPESLVQVVNQFFDYKAPHIEEWEQAVNDFSDRMPELSKIVEKIISEERQKNRTFADSFETFYALCRQAINPNLTDNAVERMLVQHLLTERIFRKIFKNSDFTRRNVVAQEIEKVIGALTSRSFNRDEFLGKLDRFYRAIERSAEETTGYSEKQAFLNKVYERFFQGYSPKEADTHGIVYTPQPIVNFMVRSVEEILQKEFGRSLGDKGVHILDPFVGTGNFIVRIMQEIKATDLQYKYENELHCNEVMLLPYYIASMNIEHAYFDRTDEYKAFPGICLVDTFELAEAEQSSLGFMNAENAERVKRQKSTPIFVVIGNPPYNANQQNENDNNKNRRYPVIEKRVAETYGKASAAVNKNTLADPYVKAFRWASDRIGEDGLVAFVTNSAFLEAIAGDGIRKHLAADFNSIYILDLGGNVRRNPKLSGTTHNVFGIQVGVSIALLVRNRSSQHERQVFLFRSPEYANRQQKYALLDGAGDVSQVKWEKIKPDGRLNWVVLENAEQFGELVGLHAHEGQGGIFEAYSNGIQSNRDDWVFNFDRGESGRNAQRLVTTYGSELDRWNRLPAKPPVDTFVLHDDHRIKWCSKLKQLLENNVRIEFDTRYETEAQYRPFTKDWLYFDPKVIHRPGQIADFFPPGKKADNVILAITAHSQIPFSLQALDRVACLDVGGRPSQVFPFYTYSEDGAHRRENITDWALEQFRARYHDPSISKWDIFHYIYAVLHHPEYRERYAANLRRELPRIPFVSSASCHPEAAESLAKPRTPNEGSVHSAGSVARASCIDPSAHKERGPQDDSVGDGVGVNPDAGIFRAFVKAGERLAEIHVQYEKQPEYPVTKTEKAGEKLDWRVTKMRLSKDKTSLIYNQFLTLSGIPPEAYEYRLGNRSALEWVIDQYQVSTDKRSGITNDPNRADDPQYIVRLIGQVTTVSLETVKIVRALPPLGLPD